MGWHEWLGKIVSNTPLFVIVAHSLNNYVNFVIDIIMNTNVYVYIYIYIKVEVKYF